MTVLQVIEHPNEVLETKCETVLTFNRKLWKLLDDMYDTMIAYDGVGLAAPQIGEPIRVAVVDIDDDAGTIELINPVILEKRGSQTDIEGCLSFPEVFGDVERAEYIKVRAQNRRGKTIFIEAEGFLARAMQHEIDHLQGVLFTTKVTRYYKPEELTQTTKGDVSQ